MDELIAFLTARLDEDEKAAMTAARLAGTDWRTNGPIVVAPLRETTAWEIGEVSPFVARHDPARALCEVEAKRAILAEYEAMDDEGLYHGLSRAIVHLAAVWSDHPDYRREWAP
jgi:hypothetical protein